MKRIAAKSTVVVLTLVMLLGAVAPASAAGLTAEQVSAILTLLSSFGADQATIDNVNSALSGGPVVTVPSTGGSTYTFTRNLTVGDTGDDVMNLQKVLNMDSATAVAVSGIGSAGSESSYFGSLTKSAVIKFQNKFAAEVLAPVGLTLGTGYVGASTRAKLNSMSTGSTGGDTTGGDTTPTPTGTGLTVSVAAQPADSLAPESASRLPFTKFTLTAGTDGDVVLNNVTIERKGLSSNAVFAGIILIDEDGTQLGLSKTLNSNNQATIGEAVTIKSGTSRVFTIAANMESNNDNHAGEVAVLALVSVNSSASVSGVLPITGAAHTINATLSIGSATAERGALDPNTSVKKEVNTTGYTFAAVKITAGSAEEITIKSIRWNQSGTASSNDLANVVVVVDGVEYGTKVSTDGKYYTANFGAGISVAKGLTKDISVKGDIVSGSDRTIVFDIDKDTDLYVVGNTFGYGITAKATPATATPLSSQFTAGTPWFDASHVTVGTGSLNISVTNDVPAGNIADGSSNVLLGSFEFDVRGEAITWSSLALTIATNNGGGGELLTNITLVDGNGSVIAGPQDPNAAGTLVTISDTVTLPVGENIIFVKGNLNNSWENGDTIVVKFNPSTAVASAKGDISGQSITATPASIVTGKTQTVKAGSLTITPASSLVNQNIIDNSSDVVLGRYVLDATASGENVKVTTVQITSVVGANADVDELNSLELFDVTNGANRALTTGSNVLNPSGHAGATNANLSFTIDSGALVVSKDAQMIVELRGSVNASSTPTVTTTFGTSLVGLDWTVTGADTGKTISENLSGAGATLTVVSSGTLTATLDTSSPSEKWYTSGDEATIGVFKFVAINEDMALTDLGLDITTASSSSADFATLKLYSGSTLISTLTSPAFTGGTQRFTFPTSGTGSFVVPEGDDGIKLTVKATFSSIGTGFAGTSASLVRIATTSTTTWNKAQGTESGTVADVLGSASNSAGARYFKSIPTVAKQSLSAISLVDGTIDLYKFSISADSAGDIEVYEMNFQVATSGTVVASSFKLTETTTGNVVRSGITGSGVVTVTANNLEFGNTVITIPAGETRNYVLSATIVGAGTSDSITIQMEGDSAYGSMASGLGETQANAVLDANSDFVWSDRSASNHSASTSDWYNGFKVLDFNASDLDTEVLSY